MGEFARLTGDKGKEIRVKRIVDISDAKVSRDPADEWITYSLGSCIGVALYDGATGVGGMLHFQLPSSKKKGGSGGKPHMYADTGMACVLKKMVSLGAAPRNLLLQLKNGAVVVQSRGQRRQL